jgi:hypothetical protein
MRVLIRIRLVKLGPLQRGRRKRGAGITVIDEYPARPLPPADVPPPGEPKEVDWNAAERLAAAWKTVSFWQCRFGLQRRMTTKRGWLIDWLSRRPAWVASSPEIASRRR